MIIIINNDVINIPETYMAQDMNRTFQQVVLLLSIKQIISICVYEISIYIFKLLSLKY